MKRLLFALSAAALIASAVLLPSTAASGGLIEAIDVGVDTTSLLAQISPAGNYGVFTVTATLSGPTAASVNITDSVGGGSIDPAVSTLDACAGTEALNSSGELTCRVELSPAAPSATIHVAVRSGLTATQVFNHAAVAMQAAGDDTLVGVDTNEANNQDSATTPVTAGSTTSGYVPEGGSMSYRSNSQTHILTVTQAKGPGGGALVTMSDPGVMPCGSQPCNGVRVWFDQGQDGGFYEAATQLDSSGKHDPCRGLGSTTCTAIFWRKYPTGPLAPEPACGTEGPTDPCLRNKYKTSGGDIHYLSELDTDDPDIGIPGIPTLGGAR
ncbi:MAG TPA: hypothetical protein VMY88_06310 [Acidimicrobiales bacterium]|nr:hypothetical protein [Acidimicrobiales bacterium]